jgi:hypothetical protein
MGEWYAKDTPLDGKTRSQAFYTAMGASIVKDLDKPIVEVRPVFYFLQEKNQH